MGTPYNVSFLWWEYTRKQRFHKKSQNQKTTGCFVGLFQNINFHMRKNILWKPTADTPMQKHVHYKRNSVALLIL